MRGWLSGCRVRPRKPPGAPDLPTVRGTPETLRTGGRLAAGGRGFVVGFPFETIVSEVQRDRLMRDALRFLTGGSCSGPDAGAGR